MTAIFTPTARGATNPLATTLLLLVGIQAMTLDEDELPPPPEVTVVDQDEEISLKEPKMAKNELDTNAVDESNHDPSSPALQEEDQDVWQGLAGFTSSTSTYGEVPLLPYERMPPYPPPSSPYFKHPNSMRGECQPRVTPPPNPPPRPVCHAPAPVAPSVDTSRHSLPQPPENDARPRRLMLNASSFEPLTDITEKSTAPPEEHDTEESDDDDDDEEEEVEPAKLEQPVVVVETRMPPVEPTRKRKYETRSIKNKQKKPKVPEHPVDVIKDKRNLTARNRFALSLSKVGKIEAKSEQERTEEESDYLSTFYTRRMVKNERSRVRAKQRKQEMARIAAIPEIVRTADEQEFFTRTMLAKERKNQADRDRRKRIKLANEELVRQRKIARIQSIPKARRSSDDEEFLESNGAAAKTKKANQGRRKRAN